MPLLVVVVILGFVFGIAIASRRVAYGLTGVAGAFLIASMAWTLADKKGDDPVWLLPAAIVGAAVALGMTRLGQTLRGRRA